MHDRPSAQVARCWRRTAGVEDCDRRRIFQKNVFSGGCRGVARVAKALGTTRTIEIPKPLAPAPPLTSSPQPKALRLHLDRLRKRPDDFDPRCATAYWGRHDPSAAGRRAQKFRRWYRAQVLEPVQIGRCDHRAGDALRRARNWGRATSCSTVSNCRCAPISASTPQPISFIGLRWSRARSAGADADRVQIIARTMARDIALRVAFVLERAGVVAHQPERIVEMQVDLPDVLA